MRVLFSALELSVKFSLFACGLMSLLLHGSLLAQSASLAGVAEGTDSDGVSFERLTLSEEFWSEGATVADIDQDGAMDVVSGPFWYAGPRFDRRTRYATGGPWAIAGYSDFFFTFAADFDADGDVDVLSVPMPGTTAWWHENPGRATDALWPRHTVLDDVGNESPLLTDLDGDGRSELVCIHGGKWGYAQPVVDAPRQPWRFTPVSGERGLGRFTHGLGVGDVNGDGRADLLERTGWWEQPGQLGDLFRFHPFPFAQSGGSQMFVYDFDGDGDQDVVSVLNAHAWGLSWYERLGEREDVSFVAHAILPDRAVPDGLNLSQMHALASADIDGDGAKDLITGKRFYAHGGNDPGAHRLPVLMWLRTVRTSDGVRFQPHLIDRQAGVGTQLTVRDLNGDQRPDVVVGNKRGTTVFLNRGRAAEAESLTSSDLAIGADTFAKAVRETPPLDPEAERRTFVLPPGFTADLVVAEPDIAKPMNLAFDSRGRLWVSSSREYPYAAPADRKGRDTIKVLEDADGDGSFETVTTFADGLNIPIGLYPYRDGVICFSIPNIWFLRDTDGDGRADRREKLYGPMGYERDTHGMCNAFTRGFDGWLYACHGFNNHTQVAGGDGHSITMQSGNIFRMRPDGSRVEHFTHGLVNPFGMAFDHFGDQYVADCHTKPVSLLLHGGYYDSFGKPHDGLGYVPNVMDHLHGSTAIGGIAICSGESFPDVYRGNTFGGNVMTSRVNRNSLQRFGGSVRAQEEPDFLVAGDPWFRPVDLQFGPDGALYVADFYNRIIGHYEVKLDHPGRDRQRGRIWRVRYTGPDTRRDAGGQNSSGSRLPRLDQLSPGDLVNRLGSKNLPERRLARDRLVDEFGEKAVPHLRQGARAADLMVRVESLWALARLNALTKEQLQAASRAADETVRVHAQRIVETLPHSEDAIAVVRSGLRDSAPLVRRQAAIAATTHRDVSFIPFLLEQLREGGGSDPHLQHSLRMALRDHLVRKDWFEETTRALEEQDVPVLAGICLALKTEHAGEFLASNLDRIPASTPQEFATYVRFSARYVSAESVDRVVAVASTRFGNDRDLQLELIRSVDTSLRERGTERPASVSRWARALATGLLGVRGGEVATESVDWRWIRIPGSATRTNPWALSRRRASADGQRNSVLFSSFPAGEKQTGIYRSSPFALALPLTFFMAGHDGYPDKAAQKKNLVRLRDAATHRILQSWSPPRNDTAQPFRLTAPAEAGQQVYLELVDGDNAGAYAWLAVGRFSDARLNPSTRGAERRKGLALCSDLQLTELRDHVVTILRSPNVGAETAADAARVLAGFTESGTLRAAAVAVGLAGTETQLRDRCIDSLVKNDPASAGKLLSDVMKSASASEQFEVALRLASDAAAAEQLVDMLERGQLSSTVLARPALLTRLRAVASEALRLRVARLTASLPAEDPAVAKFITRIVRDYVNGPGDQSRGAAIFAKNCAVCHQVAGQGKKVGPNLDGIGTRGLDRLAEDVFAPNRNVDVNFRATTIVTDEGRIHTGLLQPDAGELKVLIDAEGNAIRIPVESIEESTTSRLSPMPGNMREKLTSQQQRDLLAYLLSLGGGH